jgi:lipopolysaccharide/colanic/teichoic acid biosynthesis glycosyltransferase
MDELPQLFNVLRGEMTLVGPRPEVAKYVDGYTLEQRRVLDLHPGITDRASILFADEATLLAGRADAERFYVEQIVPEKIRINLEYAERATVLSDLRVVLETIGHLIPRSHLKPFGIAPSVNDTAQQPSPPYGGYDSHLEKRTARHPA